MDVGNASAFFRIRSLPFPSVARLSSRSFPPVPLMVSGKKAIVIVEVGRNNFLDEKAPERSTYQKKNEEVTNTFSVEGKMDTEK